MWKLIDEKTGKDVTVGDEVKTFRGETCVVADLCPPHKPASTGRVYVDFPGVTAQQGFFPSVIGAKFVEQ